MTSHLKPDDVRTWLVEYLAQLLYVESVEIDTNKPFDRYGLDSTSAVALSGDLGKFVGSEFPANLLFEYPTIEAVLRYLEEERMISPPSA